MKKQLIFTTVGLTFKAYAGYGGMGEVEDDGTNTGDLSGMVWGALIVGAIYLIWKKYF